MELIIDVGRTLAKPWKEDISPTTAVLVVLAFAVAVWWLADSLGIISKFENAIAEING